AFAIAFVAPDTPRIKRLSRILESRTYYDWRAMAAPITEVYITQNLAVFSAPEDRSKIEGWGKIVSPHVWGTVGWHDLADREQMKPEQLDECNEVYFINRSKPGVIPAAASKILGNQELKETTVFVGRVAGEHGLSVAVFSMPNAMVLAKSAEHYRNIEAVPIAPEVRDITDLRAIGTTTLIVHGETLSEGTLEQVRSTLATDMRQKLKIDVQERGATLKLTDKEITLEQLLGATDTSVKLRQSVGLKYIWMFDITQVSGETTFTAEEHKLSGDPPPFPEQEPVEPVLGLFPGGGQKEKYKIDHAKWQIDHDAWARRKNEYDQRIATSAPCQWERKVVRTSQARVQGILRLIDLNGVGKVVWERKCDGSMRDTGDLQTDRVTIGGYANKPNSMQTPAATQSCSLDLTKQTVLRSAATDFDILQAEAWLPDGTLPPLPVKPEGGEQAAGRETMPSLPPAPPVMDRPVNDPEKPYIAEISGKTITINIGLKEGVKVGDKIYVVTRYRKVVDPNDETKVLDWRWNPQDVLALRVTYVGTTSDCEPDKTEDPAKIALLQKKWNVKWVATPKTETKPQKKGHGKDHDAEKRVDCASPARTGGESDTSGSDGAGESKGTQWR
ncbi:MAG TPA: hypothetical protein VKU00_22800, partial [Chthonomonadaceae bacterium]|nr:hypothetical protein [Chthonomonadaceae bacterium]